MEPRYIILMDFACGELVKIKLTDKEVKASEEYDDFSDFLSTLEDKYDFRVKDCLYMTVESLSEFPRDKSSLMVYCCMSWCYLCGGIKAFLT